MNLTLDTIVKLTILIMSVLVILYFGASLYQTFIHRSNMLYNSDKLSKSTIKSEPTSIIKCIKKMNKDTISPQITTKSLEPLFEKNKYKNNAESIHTPTNINKLVDKSIEAHDTDPIIKSINNQSENKID